ncbi:lytic murein transglycosylase [Aquabacterium humicola]|uniref:lytic murein transglycosylase n=1 Tax=Aquabacterium humicola TaxID=3237377 RepID=UPI002542BBC2|nr:lytic murein transglycosylase [Rubrivivax pictus]
MSRSASTRRLRALAALGAAALAACGTPPAAPSPPSAPTPTIPTPASPPPVVAVPPTSDASKPTPAAAAAEVDASLPARFAAWIDRFRASARAAGIDEATLQSALADVRYLPRIVELDRAQPEFIRAIWDYLDRAVSPQRIANGREKLKAVRPEAEAAAAKHGVPATVLAAIWGIESNFGGDTGSLPVIDALATLAFDGRREAWARDELLKALKILQNGDIDRTHMTGSWAGAMGQTQFMPSVFLAHAVDADGDGRRDIWGSMADVFASTANFVARSGWRADEPWGVEVALPPGFDVARADEALRQPSARWADEGLRTIDGGRLPAIANAAVLLPAGARGPAFLVGANYRALLRYNNSTSYALAVALLAQRLADGPGVIAAWPRELVMLTRSQTSALQTALNERGFDAGTVDGLLGPATRAAVRRFQRSLGLPPDGYPTVELLQRLQPA